MDFKTWFCLNQRESFTIDAKINRVASASVREAIVGSRVDCRSNLQQEDDRWRDANPREPR